VLLAERVAFSPPAYRIIDTPCGPSSTLLAERVALPPPPAASLVRPCGPLLPAICTMATTIELIYNLIWPDCGPFSPSAPRLVDSVTTSPPLCESWL